VDELGLFTLADLSRDHAIYAFCDPCGRSVKLPTDRLAAVYGTRFKILDLRHRLTCRECGVRTGEIRIVYAVSAR
jgi:hypothetical protein